MKLTELNKSKNKYVRRTYLTFWAMPYLVLFLFLLYIAPFLHPKGIKAGYKEVMAEIKLWWGHVSAQW